MLAQRQGLVAGSSPSPAVGALQVDVEPGGHNAHSLPVKFQYELDKVQLDNDQQGSIGSSEARKIEKIGMRSFMFKTKFIISYGEDKAETVSRFIWGGPKTWFFCLGGSGSSETSTDCYAYVDVLYNYCVCAGVYNVLLCKKMLLSFLVIWDYVWKNADACVQK